MVPRWRFKKWSFFSVTLCAFPGEFEPSLTAALLSGEQDEVVPQGGRVVGERELQLELVGGAEAREGRVGQEGRVAQLLAAAAEAGAGYVDGCGTREEERGCQSIANQTLLASAPFLPNGDTKCFTRETAPGEKLYSHRCICRVELSKTS